MGRPKKQTVDYFPHFASTDSRTRFILEHGWGNDGYAFWFKLLELLCRSEGHYYDCSQPADKMYLVALTMVTEEQSDEILNTLALRGNIDSELWQERKVIWCQSLVDNLQDVYSKRTGSAPLKPFTFSEEEQEGQSPADGPETEEPNKGNGPKKAGGSQDSQKGAKGVYEEIAELYNEICTSLPKVRGLSEARKKAIRARMATGYTVDSFRELFQRAEASSFLKGKNDRNWQANFDWLIRDSNMAKVIDGNYEDKGGGNYGAYADRRGAEGFTADPERFRPSSGFRGGEGAK